MTDHTETTTDAEVPAAFVEAKSQVDALWAEMVRLSESAAVHNRDIEEGRTFSVDARASIDASLQQAQVHVQALASHVDAAIASSNQVNEFLDSARAADAGAAEAQARANSAVEAIGEAVRRGTEAAGHASSLAADIETTAAEVATKSAHIEAGRIHADEVRFQIDILLATAKEAAATTEALLQAGQSTVDGINALHGAAQETKTAIDGIGEAINLLHVQSGLHAETMKQFAGTADLVEARVKASEERLSALQQSSADCLKSIESLLAGATNAGLAHAFDTRSKTFKTPERNWQLAFVGSLAAMLGLAIWEARTSATLTTVPQYAELARMLIHRFPFFLPLIWFAIHSSRQASLAKRMEEEYAFKATISTSFEGYRRQMAEISKDLPEVSPLAQLCNDTLRNINKPPGFVYDKHRMDPTPGTAAAEIIKPIVDGVSSTLAAKMPSLKP